VKRFEDRLEFPIAELTASLHSPMGSSSGYYSTKRGADFVFNDVQRHTTKGLEN